MQAIESHEQHHVFPIVESECRFAPVRHLAVAVFLLVSSQESPHWSPGACANPFLRKCCPCVRSCKYYALDESTIDNCSICPLICCSTFEAPCVCAPLQALASCFLPLCEMVGSSVCAQRPAMPQPVDEKYPPTHNTKSSLHTERLCLGKGIGADMSALNSSRQPLRHGPEPCWPTSREIF